MVLIAAADGAAIANAKDAEVEKNLSNILLQAQCSKKLGRTHEAFQLYSQALEVQNKIHRVPDLKSLRDIFDLQVEIGAIKGATKSCEQMLALYPNCKESYIAASVELVKPKKAAVSPSTLHNIILGLRFHPTNPLLQAKLLQLKTNTTVGRSRYSSTKKSQGCKSTSEIPNDTFISANSTRLISSESELLSGLPSITSSTSLHLPRVTVHENLSFYEKSTSSSSILPSIYEQDLRIIISRAVEHLELLTPSALKEPLVILDVDDTALRSSLHLIETMSRDDTSIPAQYCPEFYNNKKLVVPPTTTILKLYKYLVWRKIKVAFISERSSELTLVTLKQLHDAGYKCESDLVFMKSDYDATVATFKHEVRKSLSQYDIWMTVSDQECDFSGGVTGLKVKIPNYLYTIE